MPSEPVNRPIPTNDERGVPVLDGRPMDPVPLHHGAEHDEQSRWTNTDATNGFVYGQPWERTAGLYRLRLDFGPHNYIEERILSASTLVDAVAEADVKLGNPTPTLVEAAHIVRDPDREPITTWRGGRWNEPRA